jgi:hypothetical protein
MNRGMVTLSLTAIGALVSFSTQEPNFPKELSQRLAHRTQDPVQAFEINGETAQSMLDLLPPPHTILDPALIEAYQAFQSFVQKSTVQKD